MSVHLTVADLIDHLSLHDRAARVVLPSPDGGFHDIAAVAPAMLTLFVNTMPGTGPHDLPDGPEQVGSPAVLLLPDSDS